MKKITALVLALLLCFGNSEVLFALTGTMGENSWPNSNASHALNNIKDKPVNWIEADNSRGMGEIELDRAQNATPIVHINRPSEGGVSVNYFKDFNVNDENLIINNHKGQTAQTNLAGVIYGNPNFDKPGSTEAEIILTEVTSINRTNLEGYVEIAGKTADLIIANPNGINVSGGGFINTARLTLIAGASGMGDLDKTLNEAGGLNPFMLSKNADTAITVVGKNVFDKAGNPVAYNLGIDAKSIDYAQLIGKIIKINGDIIGSPSGEIEIISGNEKAVYNQATRRFEVTSSNGDVSEVNPEFAIDSTAFGGIYAGRIRVIATQDGVGVRMRKDLISDVDDIMFDARGNIVLDNMIVQANRSVDIKVKDKFENAGKIISSNGQIKIAAGGDITNKGTLCSPNSINLRASGLLANKRGAQIGAKVVKTDSLQVSNEGAIRALETIEVNAPEGIETLKDSQIVSKNITVKTNGQINNAGKIHANEVLDVFAGKEITNSGQLHANNRLSIVSSRDITNTGVVSSKDITVSASSGAISNSGEFNAAQSLMLTSRGDITNTGVVSSKDITVSASSGAISNSGEFNAVQSLMLTSQGDITNNGGISSNDLQVSSLTGSIKNYGNVYSLGKMMLLPVKGLFNYAAGKIDADGDMDIETTQGTVTNEGKLYSQGTLKITAAQTIENKRGAQIDAHVVKTDSLQVSNEGTIQALETIEVNAPEGIETLKDSQIVSKNIDVKTTNGQINNAGQIHANEGLDIFAGKEITNSGRVHANNRLSIVSSRDITNTGVVSSKDITVSASSGAISNSGEFNAAQSLMLTSRGDITNTGVVSSKDITVSASSGAISNSGEFNAAQSLMLTSQGDITNNGGISSNDLQVSSLTGSIKNYGNVYSLGKMMLLPVKGLFNYAAGKIDADGDMDIETTQGTVTNEGKLYSQGTLKITAAQTIENKPGAQIDAHVVKTDSLQVSNEGTIQALETIEVNAPEGIETLKDSQIVSKNIDVKTTNGQINNAGKIHANEVLDVFAGKEITNSGQLHANNRLSIVSSRDITNTGVVSSKDITVSASSGAISNSGEFNAAQSLMLTSQGDITNNGGISSNNLQVSSLTGSIKNYGNVYTLGKMMLLPVKGLFNYAAGKIGADGGMEIETQGTVTNEGKLCAHGALKITATQTIENKPGAQIEADQINANTNDKIINYGHIYMAGGTSLLKSVNEFINNANIYSRGSFAIESSRFTNVQNALIDADTLSVKTAGDIVNNAKLYSKDSLTLNSGGKTENAQTGNISASPSGNIHIVSAGAVNNWWAIIAGGQINIQSSREIFNGGSVGSQAVISGGGLTQIKSGERIINYGYIQSVNGNLKLESSSAINWDYRLNDNGNERLNNIRRYLSQMRTDNKNDASLIRTGIHNYGRLYSRADMELNSKSVLHNNVNSLIYSVGSINFNVKEILYNNAAAIGTGIYAQRDINVSGDYGRINKLINYNGYIEAGGNIRISANEVINYGSDNIDIFAYPYAATDGGRRKELDVHVETRGTTVARLEYTSTLTSQESQIIAKSGWADINAQSSITNYNSTIYGGAGLNLTAGTVINSVGEFEVTFTNYRKRRVDLNFGARFFGGFKRGQEYRNIANSYDNEVLKSNNAKARLMSGRTVSITTNRLYNGSLSDKKGEVNQWKKESVSQEWTGIHSNVPSYGGQGVGAQTGGKYEPSYIGNGAVIDITKNLQLPRGSYGKYKPSTSPIYLYETDVLLRDMPRVNKPSTNPHNLYETDISLTDIPRVNKPSIKTHYLYETDASLRDETTFLGSQYFLNRIGLDPFNMEYKFLGDSYMEHDMLSRSLQEQGFLENLHHTPGDIDIFIERAYQSLDARKVNDMGLEFGKELTEEQINALSQDIVWYVLKGIELPNGETVQTLVPQIYLCQDTVNKLKMPQRVFEETQERVSQQQAQDIGSARAKAKGNEIAQHQMDQITKEAQEEAKTKVWQDVNNFISNNSDEYNKMVEKAYKKIQGSYNSLGESFAKNLPVFSRKTRQELMEIAKKQVNDALLDQMARETLDVYTQEISKFKEEAVIRATYDKVYEQFYQEELVKARQRNVVGINNTSLISGNDVVIQSLDGKGGVVNNSGLIDASRSVVITAEKINNATSRYGANQAAISAGNLIYLNASELGVINNDSAMMLTRNKDSAIQIDSGEFNNTTSSQIQKDEYSAGKKYITTLINPTGNVSSAGDLCINTSGNINLTGSSLSGAGKVVLDAKGNINASVIEDYSYEYKVDSKGGSGIFETKTTTVNEKEKLTNIGSFINSREGSVKMSGKNVNLQNTNIAGQSGVMLHADEDINLTTALNTDYQYSNKSKSNTFTGSQTWTKMSSSALNQGTKITSNGDINIEAGNNITAISAENNAVGSVNFISGGNTMFSAAQDCFIEESYHKKTDGLLGAVLNVDIGLKGISVGVSYKETTDREKTQNLTAVENKIISGGNIHTKAGKDVISFGTQMNAEGDISVEGQNILMMSAQNKKTKETSHEDTIVTTGIKIGNTYVDAGFAADAVVKSGEAVKKAKDEVSTMEDLYKQGKASKEALEDARINLAMATANLANATVGLTASISGAATAAGTSFGTGLYAAGFTNYETNKLSSIKEDNYATQSNLVSGTNITFKSANDMTQEGTNIHANQTLTYDIANDLTITASKDTSAQESKSEHISGGVSIGNNAVQVSAGYGQGSDRMRSTRHNNSQVTVNNIIMNVGNDALISGANIHAQNDLSINVGNNLTEESLQDTYYAKGNICDTNVNVGANFSGGKSIGGGFSTGNKYTDSAWVKQQTSLTSSGKAEINVGNKTTVTGAVIGSESGQMAFSTKELEYSNLEDRNVNRNQGFGINTSIGGNLTDQGALNLTPSGSTTLSFTKTGNEQHQTTKATIGKGTIIIDGSDTANDSKAPQELNRDLTNTQEITKDQITGALDSSITIDNRLLTSSGRASIGKDFKNFDKNVVKGASGVISTALSPITAVYSSLTAEGDGDKKIISAWKANQSANATGILRGGSKEAQEIITKIKEGAATLEEEQELANCTSSGKGNLIYSQIGEVADKETGELVLGFNDTSKQQGYVNVGNGAGTNALIFSLTDAEERAHNHTRNESIAKGAARSELGYFNAVSWLTGGNTIGDKDKSEAIEIIKYNTSNSKLNKTQQSNVREENKAYSLGSDIRTMYKGKKLPNGEIELNTIEEGISVFAEINPMGVVESVAGITSQIVGGVGVGEAIENQAKANVQESVETKKDPLDRLENELYSKDLIKDGINDIDNGKVGRGSAKLTLAGVNVLSNAMLVGAEVGAVKGLITENVIRKAGLKYVESGGKEIPSKAYRYVDPKDLVDPKDPKRESKIKREMKIPARDPENEKPTYLSFDKYDTPSPGKLQAPREASIRLEFKTKQIRDKIEVPKENYNDAKAKAYEPIVSYFKEYGKGGATQAITWSEIKIDKIVDLNKLQRNIERYDTLLGVTNTLKSANTAACRQNKALIEESNPNLDKNKK